MVLLVLIRLRWASSRHEIEILQVIIKYWSWSGIGILNGYVSSTKDRKKEDEEKIGEKNYKKKLYKGKKKRKRRASHQDQEQPL